MKAATLAGQTVARAMVTIPRFGVWWADVDLTTPAALSGRVVLELGGVSFSGAVASGGPADGKASYRIAAGAGGWGTVVPAAAYSDDAGVKVASVLADVASAAGETFEGAPSDRVGPHYARQEGPASHVLGDLLPRAWRVDFAGVTRAGAWPSGTYATTAPRVRRAPGAGVIDLAVDSIVGITPGVVVDGLPPATDVVINLDSKRLTASVYYEAALPRRIDALRKLFDALDPRRAYRGLAEYRVVSQEGDRLNLQIARSGTGLPDLARVPVRGLSGVKQMHALGSLVLVGFADSDPSRPAVVAQEAAGVPGWMPLALEIGAAPTLGVARQTDPVIAGPFGGTITLGSARIKAST